MGLSTQAGRHTGSGKTIISVGVFFLIGVGLGVWGLSLWGLLPSLWGSMFQVIFTVIGILLALLQWRAQVASGPQAFTKGLQGDDVDLGVDPYRGALVVGMERQQSGVNIGLYRDFDARSGHPYAAAIIARQKIGGKSRYTGLFPSLQPGNYTIVTPCRSDVRQVTVYAGRVTEFDWK